MSRASRVSLGMHAWVMVVGWSIGHAPARDSAREKTFRACTNEHAETHRQGAAVPRATWTLGQEANDRVAAALRVRANSSFDFLPASAHGAGRLPGDGSAPDAARVRRGLTASVCDGALIPPRGPSRPRPSIGFSWATRRCSSTPCPFLRQRRRRPSADGSPGALRCSQRTGVAEP